MRRAPGAGDDDFEAVLPGLVGELIEPIGGAMRRYNPRLETDLQRRERFSGVAHRRPVRLTPHDYGDRFGLSSHATESSLLAKLAVGRRRRRRQAIMSGVS